jgi:hypothetical protein
MIRFYPRVSHSVSGVWGRFLGISGWIPSTIKKDLFWTFWRGVVAHTYNPSTREGKAGGSWVQGQPGSWCPGHILDHIRLAYLGWALDNAVLQIVLGKVPHFSGSDSKITINCSQFCFLVVLVYYKYQIDIKLLEDRDIVSSVVSPAQTGPC